MSRSARFVGALLTLATLMMAAQSARAQACCTATGAGEMGVVGRCHQAVIAAQLSYERGVGSYDADGNFRKLEDSEVNDGVLAIGAGFRPISPSWQIHGSIPFRLQHRRLGTLASNTQFAPADAVVGARWLIAEDRMAGLSLSDARTLIPFTQPFVALGLPTGRPPEDSDEPSGADVTDDGSWKLTGGVKLIKFVTMVDSLGLRVHYTHQFERSAELVGSDQERKLAQGDELGARLAYTRVISLFWSWGAFVDGRLRSSASEDGQSVPNSSTRRVRVGARLSHYLTYPKWQVSVAVLSDTFLDQLGQNQPFVGPTLSMTLQRNFTY